LEIFEGKCIPFEILSSFVNLKKFKTGYIYESDLNLKDFHYLENTKLPKLERFSTEIEFPRLNILTKLISSTTGNLTHIFLGSFVPKETHQFIEPYHRTISKHCPNICYVSTFIYEENDLNNRNNYNSFGLEDLIKSCNKLRGIIFYGIRMFSEGFDFFNMIRRFASSTLCDIKIVGECGLKSHYLEWFLESWRSRIPLSLSISEDVYELSEDLDEVKDKFLDKGVLKNYIITDYLEDFETV